MKFDMNWGFLFLIFFFFGVITTTRKVGDTGIYTRIWTAYIVHLTSRLDLLAQDGKFVIWAF